MSELQNIRHNDPALRRRLLATVSALALLASAYSFREAKAADGDADQPVLWVELGGQLSHLEDGQEQFAPPFLSTLPKAGFSSPLPLEKPPLYSVDEEGKISFQPHGSDWVFSASIRYGRTKSNRFLHQQTALKNPYFTESRGTYNGLAVRRYEDAKTSYSETHLFADFMAGKDVGLGMFGMKGRSVLSGGLRFAQFKSRSSATINADPDRRDPQRSSGLTGTKYRHNFSAQAQDARSFHAIGPAISWDASAPVAGDSQGGNISVDWGANGAALFGRQKMQEHHQITGKLQTGLSFPPIFIPMTTHYTHVANPSRSRSVVVPNLGGFAGLSFRYADAKISFGYRGDFFFGAMDGGIDVQKRYNRGFYGPFANLSIGIGD